MSARKLYRVRGWITVSHWVDDAQVQAFDEQDAIDADPKTLVHFFCPRDPRDWTEIGAHLVAEEEKR